MSISLPLPLKPVSVQVLPAWGENTPLTWAERFRQRFPVATGIFEFVAIWSCARLLLSPALLPQWSLPVMPLGLPDLHASLDALVFAAQAFAAEPNAVAPAAPAIPTSLPSVPGLDGVIVNLGGWAAILWGLANKIGGQIDRRVSSIEAKLEQLSPMPKEMRLLRRELRRYRRTPTAHPLPGGPVSDHEGHPETT